jgi:hypothetical protein
MSNPSQRAAKAPVLAHAPHSPDFKRRRFLLALGAGGAGAAAAATQSLAGPVVPVVADAPADAPQGYRETDHVRDYYATTRI